MSAIIFNGNIVPSNQACIKHNDRGLTLGHGLFETILIKENSIPALDYHWERIVTSAPLINLAIPFSYSILQSMIKELLIENKLKNKLAGVRLTITHGDAERGILPSHLITPNFIISAFEHSCSTQLNYSTLIVKTRKNEYSPSCNIKSTSYLDNILAKKEAINANYNEAVLLNTISHIADGAITNIFMIKHGQIFTPQLSDGALPGVVRSILLHELKQFFPITEKSITISELLDADEMFVTNALMGIQPVYRLNNKIFQTFSITSAAAEALRKKKNYI